MTHSPCQLNEEFCPAPAIETLNEILLISDLLNSYGAGRAGGALGSWAIGKTQAALSKLATLSPKQWLGIKLLAPKSVAKAAPRVERAVENLESGATKEREIPTIGGRAPINSRYAGEMHPAGVEFNEQGFPNFSPHSAAEVEINGLTGNFKIDAKLANEAMGFPNTPRGYAWHHVEDGRTMQLIPQDIHQSVRHTGGAAVIRNGGFD